MSTRPGTAASRPCGMSHVAVVTADLDGYRSFYEETIGLDTALVLAAGPGHGRQATVFAGGPMLHVFEVGDHHAWAEGTGSAMLRRGRVDHFGWTVPDVAALTEVWYRLLAAGASSGDIRPLGPCSPSTTSIRTGSRVRSTASTRTSTRPHCETRTRSSTSAGS